MFHLKVQKRPGWEGFRSTEQQGGEIVEVGSGSALSVASTAEKPRLRELVVATNLSVEGTAALTTGRALADRAGANLSVINVVEPITCPELPYPEDLRIARWVSHQIDTAHGLLETELEEVGLGSAPRRVIEGDPATIVAAFAEEARSDLVVVGAHRLSKFERVLAGSVGERIVRHTICPVMVAKRIRTGPFKRILVAVDLSSASKLILMQACRLAECDESEVRVVYSEEPSQVFWRKMVYGHHLGRKTDWGRLEEFVQGTGFRQPPRSKVLRGHAGRALLDEARNWEADLMVMGLRRFNPLFWTRLGRTARYVLRHGDRSVVLVPS